MLHVEAGGGGRSPPPQAQGGQKRASPTATAAVRKAPAPAAVPNQEKDPKMKLKEYCEKNKLKQPEYEEVKRGPGDLLHQQRVMVMGQTFVGKSQNKKRDAEKSAAQEALNKLNIN